MNRRGFLQLLGALGAAAALPEVATLAEQEAATSVPIPEGDGLWWTPYKHGALPPRHYNCRYSTNPTRLKVLDWRIMFEQDVLEKPTLGAYRELGIVPGSKRSSVQLEVLGEDFEMFDVQSGRLTARLGDMRLEWDGMLVGMLGMRTSPGGMSVVEVELRACGVPRAEEIKR